MNFTTQSQAWIFQISNRKRKPIKPSSHATFQAYLHKWIVPVLGQHELADFGNAHA
jgi:hypothetical protein